MKSKVLIISFLVLALIGAFTLTAHSQTYVYGTKEGNVSKIESIDSSKKILIGDETWLKINNADAKITTTMESVFTDISLKFGTKFKKLMITYKHANGQAYKEYVITIPLETANNIKEWAKTNL